MFSRHVGRREDADTLGVLDQGYAILPCPVRFWGSHKIARAQKLEDAQDKIISTMESNIILSQSETLEAINRSEVDMQIATAKRYPRDVHNALSRIETLATMDTDTASECFYVLRRNGGSSAIEGVSVRMAEIIAGAWGNLRVQTRIIGNDGRTITAQGICQDLETNFAVSVEVKRRITDKNGKTFSEDMQVVTGNAASAIAFRNAVLKVVPKAITKHVIEHAKQVSLGQALDMETTIKNMLVNYSRLGVNESDILELMGVKDRASLDKEAIFELRGLFNAIKEGTTTVKEGIFDVLAERKANNAAERKAAGVSAAIEQRKREILAAQKERAAQKAEEQRKLADIPEGQLGGAPSPRPEDMPEELVMMTD